MNTPLHTLININSTTIFLFIVSLIAATIVHIILCRRIIRLKKELSYRQEEIICLKEELRKCQDTRKAENVEEAIPQDVQHTRTQVVPSITLTDKDRALYDRITHEITSRKLYLEASFNKNELMKEIHVPSYKFAALFKTFAGCTYSQYIQNCRLDYAIALMSQHPNWSMESVAKEAKMSRAAFYKQFQMKFGTPPTNYNTTGKSTPPICNYLIIKTLKVRCYFHRQVMSFLWTPIRLSHAL